MVEQTRELPSVAGNGLFRQQTMHQAQNTLVMLQQLGLWVHQLMLMYIEQCKALLGCMLYDIHQAVCAEGGGERLARF